MEGQEGIKAVVDMGCREILPSLAATPLTVHFIRRKFFTFFTFHFLGRS